VTKWFAFRDTVEAAVSQKLSLHHTHTHTHTPLPSGRELSHLYTIMHLVGSAATQSIPQTSVHRLLTLPTVPHIPFEPYIGQARGKYVLPLLHVHMRYLKLKPLFCAK